MTILEDELHKEKLILKKVSNLVENTIDDLKKEVRVSEDALTEFKDGLRIGLSTKFSIFSPNI